MTMIPGPTVRRRRLGRELRRLRAGAGKTIEEAARWAGIQPPTISKIENGRQAIRPTNVRLLLQLYGVEAAQADTLIKLASEANERGWWTGYRDIVPAWFRTFVDLEADASEINSYCSELVPEQLQTAEYTEAVALAVHPSTTQAELAQLVAFRHERQRRLAGNTPARLHFVLDEAVLRRLVGGADAFRQQLDHLAEMAQLPHVTLQVLPFAAGAHAALGQAFTMLRLPCDETGLDVVYLEHNQDSQYLEHPADIERYQTIFTRLTTAALSSDGTSKLLVQARDETGAI